MNDLRQLLEPDSLEMHVMPIVRFKATPQVAVWLLHGVEALVRGPVGSSLRRPDLLFEAAREAGLSLELDLECMRRSMQLLPAVHSGQRLFVNVLVETILHDAFPSLLEAMVPACCRRKLVIEVLEGPVSSFARLRERLTWLHSLGIETAIDDVGAPGSDLERLARMGRVHYVKVDQLVVRRLWPSDPMTALNWLWEVGMLADALSAELLVEGIEGEDRTLLQELRRLGVGFGQGYLFGEPVGSQSFQWWQAPSHRCVSPSVSLGA